MFSGSSEDECIHGEVIQLHLKTLVREVDLSNGFLIDEMLENGSLNMNEKIELDEMSKIDKTRKLVSILARNDKGKFKKFLQVISQEDFYPHVAKLLNESYDKKLRENENYIACIRCFIVQQVNIKQIMDHLCENRLIDFTDVDKIIQGDKGFEHEFWGNVFEKISDSVWGKTCVLILKEALDEHYHHIAKKIHCQENLKCHCSSSSLSCNTGSVGDGSEISTSTVIPNSKPETHEWVKRHTASFMQSTTHTYILEPKPRSSLHSGNGRDREDLVKVRKRQNQWPHGVLKSFSRTAFYKKLCEYYKINKEDLRQIKRIRIPKKNYVQNM